MVALAGCSKKSDVIKDKGSFAPIITGLSNTTGEPAVRGIPNTLEALITNVNGLALNIHWSASAGVLSDSTGPDAVWTPPDTIGTYDVTISLTANDGTNDYFKSTTFRLYVDNEYERWTRGDGIQYDPAPTPGGGVLYAEFRNNLTGEGDVYRVAAPGGMPERLTQDFYSVASPTPRGDEAQIAFAGRRRSSDSTSIWLMPWAGGDTLAALKLTQANTQFQRYLSSPRFAWNGGFLMYASDSNLVGLPPKLFYRDVVNPAPPIRLVSNSNVAAIVFNSYHPANWGPGGSGSAPPDSFIGQSYYLFGFVGQEARGAFKFKTPGFLDPPPTTDQVWVPDTTIAEPDWSSDGQYIVFSRRAPGAMDRDIWIIPTDATSFSQAAQVTRGPADDAHPRFSKDGQTILFTSNRQDRYGLNGVFATERRGTNVWGVRRFDRP
jgi:hypothetical protein